MKLFLDTNVLIDFILERPAFYLPTAMNVSFAVEGKIELAASSMSVVTASFICVERSKMPLDNYWNEDARIMNENCKCSQ